MNREIHVRFWEGLGVRFPRATHSRPLICLDHVGKCAFMCTKRLCSSRLLAMTSTNAEPKTIIR